MNPFPGRRRTIVASKKETPEAPSTVTLEPVDVKWEEEASVLPKKEGRGLCPVCNVKPNYYFHRKNCKG